MASLLGVGVIDVRGDHRPSRIVIERRVHLTIDGFAQHPGNLEQHRPLIRVWGLEYSNLPTLFAVSYVTTAATAGKRLARP
jgi:hypothetical protein